MPLGEGAVPGPGYDRTQVVPGVVHFGVGGFHRAHQAMYHDRLLNAGKGFEYGICGVGVMPQDRAMKDALEAQDYRPIPQTAFWFTIELARRPGTVGDLARRLEMTKQAASRLADQLVALGYCDRERSETNRRQVLLSATPEGQGAAMVLLAAIQKVDASMLASLDKDQREVFHLALGQMLG